MHQPSLRSLYKRILQLHRSLPQDLRELGDGYAKEEFRRHIKGATERQHKTFLAEWSDYYTTLANQVGLRGVTPGDKAEFGKPIQPGKLDDFQDDQLFQLYDLKCASTSKKQSPDSEGR